MPILKYNGYEGSADIDLERMVLRGKLLFIDDLVTYEANNPEQLYKEFRAAVDDYVATCQQLGIQPKNPLKGQFNVRISPELHRRATLLAREREQTLNEFIRDCISLGCSLPESHSDGAAHGNQTIQEPIAVLRGKSPARSKVITRTSSGLPDVGFLEETFDIYDDEYSEKIWSVKQNHLVVRASKVPS